MSVTGEAGGGAAAGRAADCRSRRRALRHDRHLRQPGAQGPHRARRPGRRQPQQRDDQPAGAFSPPIISPPARSPVAPATTTRSLRPTACSAPRTARLRSRRARSKSYQRLVDALRACPNGCAPTRVSRPTICGSRNRAAMNAAVEARLRTGRRPRTGSRCSTPPACRAGGSWEAWRRCSPIRRSLDQEMVADPAPSRPRRRTDARLSDQIRRGALRAAPPRAGNRRRHRGGAGRARLFGTEEICPDGAVAGIG